jgi:hypothetical protein
MAYDPRPEILAKFTDSKVSGTGKYKTEYVEIHIRERNPTLHRTYNTSKGIISLDPPTMVKPVEKSIGGKVINQTVLIPCHLFIPVDESLDYQVDTFINDIVHAFEDTIFDNQLATLTNGVITWDGCSPIPSKSGMNHRRLIYIRARKYEDYT